MDRAIQPVIDRFDEQMGKQRSIVDRFRYFSPAILTQEALNDVSGTGLPRHQNFMSQAYAFLDTWQSYFFQRIFRRTLLSAEDLKQIPAFVYSEEPERALTDRIGTDLAGIFIPIGILSLASWIGIRRFFAAT